MSVRSGVGALRSGFSVLSILAFGATIVSCASPRGGAGEAEPGPVPGAEEEAPRTPAEEAGTSELLGRVERLRASNPERAAAVADSAYFRWRDEDGLRAAALRALRAGASALRDAGQLVEAAARFEEFLAAQPPETEAAPAVTALAELRIELGLHPAAVELLISRSSGLVEARRRDLLERAAAGLSASELEDAMSSGSLEPWVRGILRTEQDRIAAARNDETTVPRVEVVLPLSGSLAPVGRYLRQGMEVALEAHRSAGRDSVAVVFRDDRSSIDRARDLVASAARTGAVAVVGPARSGAFAAAVDEREDPALLVVSPTATRAAGEGWNAFTLWGLERRERELAGELARWMVSDAGVETVAVLRPRGMAGIASEQAFRAAARRAGGGVVGATSYVPDSTTFESEIALLTGHEPDGVYVASRDPRTALQIAPQLSYYGLPAAAVAGGSGWREPVVVRRLRNGSPSLYATATFTDRGEGSPWHTFKVMYEKQYDTALSDNILPALGYDAMTAVLDASATVGLPRRGAVSRAATGEGRTGATGEFRFRRGMAAAVRRATVRLATDGRLAPADPGRLRDWVREARERQGVQQRRLRERAAERVARWVDRWRRGSARDEGNGDRP